MLLPVGRWMLSAALAAGAGVYLALWQHDALPGGVPPVPAEPASARSAGGVEPPGSSAGVTARLSAAGAASPAVAGRAGRGRAAAVAQPAAAAVPVAAASAAHGRLEALAGNLEDLARHEPEEALRRLSALEPAAFRYLGEDVVRAAARHAPQRALAWLDANVADDPVRQWLRAAALTGAATQDPVFALHETQSLGDSELRRTARQQVLETWAAADAVAAFEWVRGHDGPDAADLHAVVIHAYARRSPAEAGHVIASLPDGSIRNRLVEEHAWGLASSDPTAAVDWVLGLADQQVEARALAAVFDEWARRDPAGLAGSLDRLPEAHRESALARVSGDRAIRR